MNGPKQRGMPITLLGGQKLPTGTVDLVQIWRRSPSPDHPLRKSRPLVQPRSDVSVMCLCVFRILCEIVQTRPSASE